MDIGVPTAAHFIFIPAVLLIGVVVGWILGSRAARRVCLEMRKREMQIKSEIRDLKTEIAYRRGASLGRGRREPFLENTCLRLRNRILHSIDRHFFCRRVDNTVAGARIAVARLATDPD